MNSGRSSAQSTTLTTRNNSHLAAVSRDVLAPWPLELSGVSPTHDSKEDSISHPSSALATPRQTSKRTTLKARLSQFLSNPLPRHVKQGSTRSPSFIRANLPVKYQKFANPVHSSYGFWKEHVLPMEKKQRKLLETRFICRIFLAIPDLQPTMVEHNLASVGQRAFSTIQWLLRTLYRSDMSKLIQRLEGITTAIRETLPSLNSEHVSQTLVIFHDVIADTFGDHLYTLQIRASFERLLSMAVDIATEEDFLAQETKIQSDTDFDNYMQSVESCLNHSVGKKYLQLFMRSQWNEELFGFLQSYTEFKSTYGTAMIELANEIIDEFIQNCAPNQINISYEARVACLQRQSDNIITSAMFEEAFQEVMQLIKGKIWKDFRSTMDVLRGDNVAPKKMSVKFLAPTRAPGNTARGNALLPLPLSTIHSPDIDDSSDDNNDEYMIDNSPSSPSDDISHLPSISSQRIINQVRGRVDDAKEEYSVTFKSKSEHVMKRSATLTVPRLSASVSQSSLCRRSQELSHLLTPKCGWFVPMRDDNMLQRTYSARERGESLPFSDGYDTEPDSNRGHAPFHSALSLSYAPKQDIDMTVDRKWR